MAKKSKPQQPQQLSPERFIRERGRSIPVEKCYLDLQSIKELGEGKYNWGTNPYAAGGAEDMFGE